MPLALAEHHLMLSGLDKKKLKVAKRKWNIQKDKQFYIAGYICNF